MPPDKDWSYSPPVMVSEGRPSQFAVDWFGRAQREGRLKARNFFQTGLASADLVR